MPSREFLQTWKTHQYTDKNHHKKDPTRFYLMESVVASMRRDGTFQKGRDGKNVHNWHRNGEKISQKVDL